MLKWALIGVASLVALVVAFVVWRLWATIAGGSRAYAALREKMRPVVSALDAGETPAAADLERFAADRATRKVLHEELEERGRLDLFPAGFLTQESMAEADMCAWLNHPNELAAIPDEIELMEVVPSPGDAGGRYYLFRYRVREPHWAAKDGWMAGVAGPYPAGGPVARTARGTFSRFEAYDSRTPAEHVRAVHDLIAGR
jgi:hypothetical protein